MICTPTTYVFVSVIGVCIYAPDHLCICRWPMCAHSAHRPFKCAHQPSTNTQNGRCAQLRRSTLRTSATPDSHLKFGKYTHIFHITTRNTTPVFLVIAKKGWGKVFKWVLFAMCNNIFTSVYGGLFIRDSSGAHFHTPTIVDEPWQLLYGEAILVSGNE